MLQQRCIREFESSLSVNRAVVNSLGSGGHAHLNCSTAAGDAAGAGIYHRVAIITSMALQASRMICICGCSVLGLRRTRCFWFVSARYDTIRYRVVVVSGVLTSLSQPDTTRYIADAPDTKGVARYIAFEAALEAEAAF
jgi:hypothetical protein